MDRLVKVWLKDGSEKWVLVHVEVQPQRNEALPKRLFQYYFRTFDLFDGAPLTCLAILGDNTADWKPQSFSAGWWGTSVAFQFRVEKLKEYNDRLTELELSRNPFARFVLAHLKTVETQGDYETRSAWKVRIIQGLYEMGVSEAEIGQLYHDFDWLLGLPEALAVRYYETIVRFEEERDMPHLTTAERIGRKIGRDEGEAVGRIKEAAASIMEILEARQGEVSVPTAARLAQITDLNHLCQLCRLLVTGAMEEFETEIARLTV